MKRICLLILLFSLTKLSKAQEWGYVILQNNDTIRCETELTPLGVPKYRINHKIVKKIKTEDIKEFCISEDSSIYKSEILQSGYDPVFCEVLVDGKICLYRYVNPSPRMGGIFYYLNKDNDKFINLKTNIWGKYSDDGGWKKILDDMLSDEPKIELALNAQHDVTIKDIQKYINQYDLAERKKSEQ